MFHFCYLLSVYLGYLCGWLRIVDVSLPDQILEGIVPLDIVSSSSVENLLGRVGEWAVVVSLASDRIKFGFGFLAIRSFDGMVLALRGSVGVRADRAAAS